MHFATLSAAIRCPWSADAEEGVGPQPVFVAAFETYRTDTQVALRCFVALLKMLSMFCAISSRGSSKTQACFVVAIDLSEERRAMLTRCKNHTVTFVHHDHDCW